MCAAYRMVPSAIDAVLDTVVGDSTLPNHAI